MVTVAEPAQETDPYQAFVEILQENGRLKPVDLNKARRLQNSTGTGNLPDVLIKLGLCSERVVAETLAQATDLELAETADYPQISPFSDNISLRFLTENHVIGLAETDDAIIIAVMDALDSFIGEALTLACAKKIIVKVGVVSEIDRALELQYGEGKSQMNLLNDNLDLDDSNVDDIDYLKDLASEAPVIKMVNLIMQKAVETKASDIHIEPFDKSLKVRLRIDGVLQDIEAPSIASTAAVISRIKIMADLNIAER